MNDDRVPPVPRLGESIFRHTDKLILQYRKDLNASRELLIESRHHAKQTQNLGLMRRIDSLLHRIGIASE